MIPLNKPLIISSHKGINLDEFLKSRYFNKYYEIVLSARQGLSIIYKHLYDKYGKCRVAVSPLTCFEALYPILNNNHEIVFVDIDTATLNMDISSIPDNVDIIQPIHLGGNPMNIKEVLKIAKDINALIVEDCAQALGAQYDGQHLGFNSDFAVFNLMKNIFALGGGYILSSTEFNSPYFISLGFFVFGGYTVWLGGVWVGIR